MIPAPFATRVETLRAAMRAAGAEAFLCDHAEMLHWLTGFTISETFYRGCVLPLEGDPVWVLRAIDEVPCRAATWVGEVVTYADHEDAHATMAEVLKGLGVTRIGADFTSFGFTAFTRDRLTELVPGVEWRNLHEISNRIRDVKDRHEIDLIAQAADGSARDGLSLLDQAIALGGSAIEVEAVRDMLGLSDYGRLVELFEAIARGQTEQVLTLFDALYNDGADPAAVVRSIAEFAHELTRLHVTQGEARLTSGEGHRDAMLACHLALGWQALSLGQQAGLDLPRCRYRCFKSTVCRDNADHHLCTRQCCC